MAHERQIIRERVVALLTGTAPDYATAAQGRVFKTRVKPMTTAELPAINVYCTSEIVDAETVDSAPRRLKRTAVVVVEGWVSQSADVDDKLDDLALEIETAMDVDPSLGAAAFDSALAQTELDYNYEGDRPMGYVRLDFTVEFESCPRLEEATDLFDTAHVRTNLGGELETADEATDLVTNINQEP